MQAYKSGEMSVHRLPLGPLKTNCYVVGIGENAFIIDPVDDADGIGGYCDALGLRLRFGMLTHAHFDHVGAAAGLIAAGRFETLWLHPADAQEMNRGKTYSLLIAKRSLELPDAGNVSHYDAEFTSSLAQWGFEIRHLPGHTPGSCIIYSVDRKLLFTGDIILNNSVRGVRTAVGEDRTKMQAAVTAIAQEFAPRTLVFPGHGALTLLETEMTYNATIGGLLEKAS